MTMLICCMIKPSFSQEKAEVNSFKVHSSYFRESSEQLPNLLKFPQRQKYNLFELLERKEWKQHARVDSSNLTSAFLRSFRTDIQRFLVIFFLK